VDIDVFVVMPNHVHGILLLTDGAVALPTVVGSFKSAASRQINSLSDSPGVASHEPGELSRA